ncbi:uncharacterized protein LOC133370825 [Rhineura floridana]|uniref:uncharacterized protein LOC133370825 n=1 Tax=Rhineura floridana TaxID=261503 RepID=UPI002AC83624|nr:uncharacterized protein LOC133370825 [Rhineura floridana]XP_061453681.1 uncharacterized protein LOC133370825 [Rhineura floridana]
MASLLSNGFQWALGAGAQFLKAQLQRFLVRLLWTIVLVVLLSVLLTAIWLAMDKADYSPVGTSREVAVTTKQWLKSSGIIKILKDALLQIATMLPSYEPLTVGNLLKHRDRLAGMNYLLQACFNFAIDVFSKEPLAVQQNAQMVIQCDGPPIEFRSGNGDCEISVYLLYEKIQYDIRERTAEMHLVRLSSRKEPLSVGDLLRVRSSLQSWGVLSEELGGCLVFAVQEFAKEPICVQDNAHMVVDCGGWVLKFASGSGENNINVYDVQEGIIHYRVRISGLWASTVRFFHGKKDHVYTRPGKPLQLE